MTRSGFFLLIIGFFGFACAAPKGDCDIKKLDACAADIFVFATANKVPTTAAEHKPYCAKQLKSEACARDYVKRCTDSVVQGIASIFLDDVKAEIEERCSKGSTYQNDFFKHAPCLNKAGDSVHRCFQNVNTDMDVASRLPTKQRIGGACCKFNVFEACVLRAVEEKCSNEAVEFTKGLLDRYAGELLGTVCTTYRSGEKCKSIVFDSQPGDKNIRAVLTPLITVAAALG
uniref:Putative secreted protein n=1 Tax=Amblyomma triste TaxID=251400 RepID=A0A023GDP2_AMBTT